jgi:hypothetical protein
VAKLTYPDDAEIPEREQSWDSVLDDYGIDPAITPEEMEARKRWEGERECKWCGDIKIISPIHCDFPFQRRGKGSFRHVCNDCRRDYEAERRRNKPGPRKLYKQEMEAAPRVAALQLLEAEPEALALLIKHFKKPFEAFYYAERDRVIKKEEERLERFRARPQSFQSRADRGD